DRGDGSGQAQGQLGRLRNGWSAVADTLILPSVGGGWCRLALDPSVRSREAVGPTKMVPPVRLERTTY
ncbi:MAG: hypothetical protein V2I43_05725, partial [Parvularcula sp.]|nr:hypothetical protein [Parvularcula sp.]